MVNAPLSGINGSLVNMDGSHYSGSAFTNRVIPSSVNPNVLPEPLSNIQAANSYIPCKGGSNRKSNKKTQNRIKKISKKYKMASKKTRTRRRRKLTKLRRSVKSILKKNKKSRKTRRHRRSKKRVRFQKGGWAQYHLNVPNTPTYSTGGELSAANSALANPVPFKTISNCTNCVDNYDRYTNTGSVSKGQYDLF